MMLPVDDDYYKESIEEILNPIPPTKDERPQWSLSAWFRWGKEKILGIKGFFRF